MDPGNQYTISDQLADNFVMILADLGIIQDQWKFAEWTDKTVAERNKLGSQT